MIRQSPFLATIAIALASCSLKAAGESPKAPKKPNIILVMADDHGWGDAGYNGHPFVSTPTLDAMAKSGFVFDRFYAGAPVCSPTRASVMPGRSIQ